MEQKKYLKQSENKEIYYDIMNFLSNEVKQLLEGLEQHDYSSEDDYRKEVKKVLYNLPDELVTAYLNDKEDKEIAKKRFEDKKERLWKFIMSFDVNSIPKSVRDEENRVDYRKRYNEYRSTLASSGESIDWKSLNEEDKFEQNYSGVDRLIDIDENAEVLPAVDLVNKLNSIFSIKSQYNAYRSTCNDVESIRIKGSAFIVECEPFILTVPLSDKVLNTSGSDERINIHIVDRVCMQYGYYRVRYEEDEDDEGNTYGFCMYIPVRDVPVEEQLRYGRLVHASPKQFYEQIKKEGIIVRNSKRTYNYLYPKAYFYLEKASIPPSYDDMMRGICIKSFNIDMIESTIYNIYRIEVEDCPGITLYWDPVADGCVYTRKNISPRVIKRTHWVDFNKMPIVYHKLRPGSDGKRRMPDDMGRTR